MSDMTVDALIETKEKLAIVVSALADIAFSKDMTLEVARAKAKRLYEQYVDPDSAGDARD